MSTQKFTSINVETVILDIAENEEIIELPPLLINNTLDKESFNKKVKELLQQFNKEKTVGIFF